MTTVREQARKAAHRKALPDDYDDRYLPSRLVDAADAASDVWEPIAKTLRDHTNTLGGCLKCFHSNGGDPVEWPCQPWQEASEALSD